MPLRLRAGSPLAPTAAQLGAASVPQAHAGPPGEQSWGGSNAGVDPRRAQTFPRADVITVAADPEGFRSPVDAFRARTMLGPDTMTPDGSKPAAHVIPGAASWGGSNAVPDPRRVFDWTDDPAGYPLPIEGQHPITPEVIANTRVPVQLNPEPLIDRPRAGSTGADPYRRADTPRWIFQRPFDKGIADRLGITPKLPEAGPLASRPLSFASDVSGAYPSPGGGQMAPGMQSVYVQPNSLRVMPRPWDELLINTGGPSAAADPGLDAIIGRRAAGWRA